MMKSFQSTLQILSSDVSRDKKSLCSTRSMLNCNKFGWMHAKILVAHSASAQLFARGEVGFLADIVQIVLLL